MHSSPLQLLVAWPFEAGVHTHTHSHPLLGMGEVLNNVVSKLTKGLGLSLQTAGATNYENLKA